MYVYIYTYIHMTKSSRRVTVSGSGVQGFRNLGIRFQGSEFHYAGFRV